MFALPMLYPTTPISVLPVTAGIAIAPIERRMPIGNSVSVQLNLVVSTTRVSPGTPRSILKVLQILNPAADRLLCAAIDRAIMATTVLGKRRFQRTLQVGNGYSVCEHPITSELLTSGSMTANKLRRSGAELLDIRQSNGEFLTVPIGDLDLHQGDHMVLFGLDHLHDTL
jgi:hypothetical protein